MLVETGIHVTEQERMDFSFMLTSLNTAMEFITKPIPMDTTEEQLEEYYDGLMKYFKEAKIKEHHLRCAFATKYNVPYEFSFDNGAILIEKED